jgi:hypothetical protein
LTYFFNKARFYFVKKSQIFHTKLLYPEKNAGIRKRGGRIPNEKSLRSKTGPRGITPQPSRLKIRVTIGARKNRLFVACDRITCSLITSFRASTNGCSRA